MFDIPRAALLRQDDHCALWHGGAAQKRRCTAVSQKGGTQPLTGLHPGAPWQLCAGPAETCAGSHPRSHREGGCGPKGPFSLRGVSGCVFSIAPLGPYLNTLSVTFYSQNGYFESIFHHKYADDRKIPQNRPTKFVKNAPALQSAPGPFHSFEYFFQRAALLASNSVRSCTLR